MQDIMERVDRAKAILAKPEPPVEERTELALMMVDLLGEFVVNSRRIAVALERIAAPSASAAPPFPFGGTRTV